MKKALWRFPEEKEKVEKEGFPREEEFPRKMWEKPISRKNFLQLVGASLAMGTMHCFKAPTRKIIPFVERPSEYVPGEPIYYATSWVKEEEVVPLVIKTLNYRPLKIAGNSEDPVYKGATSLEHQASLWDLYDPDRIRYPYRKEKGKQKPLDKEGVKKELIPKLLAAKNILILARESFSPSLERARDIFRKKYKANLLVYDPVGNWEEMIFAEEKVHGRKQFPQIAIEKAQFILAVENDFLGTWVSPSLFTKRFSSRRLPEGVMLTLWSVESNLTLTGANADKRFPIYGKGALWVLGGILYQLGEKIPQAKGYQKYLSRFTPEKVEEQSGLSKEDLKKIVDKLLQNRGSSLVLAGGISSREKEPGMVMGLALLINHVLGNIGKTLLYSPLYKEKSLLSPLKEVKNLVKKMEEGEIDVLIIENSNPVLDLPQGWGFKKALKKVPLVIYMGMHEDESAKYAKYVLPISHYLESWGDGLREGVYYISQPVLRPLWNTYEVGAWYLMLSQEEEDYHAFVQKVAQGILKGPFKKNWEETLSNGYKKLPVGRQKGVRASFSFLNVLKEYPKEISPQKMRLVLYKNVCVGESRNANNAYRQEIPDPISRVTWGNYVAISPLLAKEKGIENGRLLRIRTTVGEMILPAFLQPGLKKNTFAVAIGYGHWALGKVAKGVGENPWKVIGEDFSPVVEWEILEEEEPVATTQWHHTMEGRYPVHYATYEEYLKNPRAGNEEVKLPGEGLYPKHEHPEHRWAMVVDLSKCTGCGSCVASCYLENNVPVVGKEEVLVSREMAWIRIDRYYVGEEENPEVLFQPVMCQQCDNAPCETVCPVWATSHSPDGLNDMAYNRCIGTRYCANNCPYKVRRFNWWENWEGKIRHPLELALNPEVTVRSRGVMEKCTFCVQRIRDKTQNAKVEGRKIEDGEIRTACQEACPADAIIFGDLKDKKSQVSKLWDSPRAYRLLVELNTQPGVSYLTQIKPSS